MVKYFSGIWWSLANFFILSSLHSMTTCQDDSTVVCMYCILENYGLGLELWFCSPFGGLEPPLSEVIGSYKKEVITLNLHIQWLTSPERKSYYTWLTTPLSQNTKNQTTLKSCLCRWSKQFPCENLACFSRFYSTHTLIVHVHVTNKICNKPYTTPVILNDTWGTNTWGTNTCYYWDEIIKHNK